MSNIDGDIVTNCWSKIKSAKGTDFFVDTFFQLLLERHPEMRSLFPDDLQTQKTTLLSMLHSAISGIDFIDDLEKEIMELGENHKNRGIKKDMFDHFVVTLVAAANLSSDFSFTDKELVVWENTFRKISGVMQSVY